MDRLTRWVLRWPKTTLVLILLVTVAFAAGVPRLQIDNSIDSMLPVDHPARVLYDEVNDTFGGTDILVVALESDDVFSADTLNQVVDLTGEFEAVPGVDKVNVKAFDSWGDQVETISSLRPEEKPVLPSRYPCPNLWYHVHIYWDGTLVSCDRDFNAAYPLGNVRDGVMKAWRGPEMTRLRLKHIDQDLADVPSCGNCVEWAWWKPTWTTAQGNAPLENE